VIEQVEEEDEERVDMYVEDGKYKCNILYHAARRIIKKNYLCSHLPIVVFYFCLAYRNPTSLVFHVMRNSQLYIFYFFYF
jgi:hypothetical protein